MIGIDLTVDPRSLLRVRYRDSAGIEQERVALTCRYVPVTAVGRGPSVALEVLWDPAEQSPAQPYWCPQDRLQRLIMAPAKLLRVRPFR